MQSTSTGYVVYSLSYLMNTQASPSVYLSGTVYGRWCHLNDDVIHIWNMRRIVTFFSNGALPVFTILRTAAIANCF